MSNSKQTLDSKDVENLLQTLKHSGSRAENKKPFFSSPDKAYKRKILKYKMFKLSERNGIGSSS